MTNLKILTAADLHQSERLYAQLAVAVDTHQPDVVALVGDFLDATESTKGKLPVDECARALANLHCPELIFIRGNHEDSALWTFREQFQETGREFVLLSGKAMTYGPLVVVGFPCLGSSGDGCFEEVPNDPEKWLPALMRQFGPAARSLWLMHEPATGTCLSAKSGYLLGNPEWREAMERFWPRIVVFGHDHHTPVRSGRFQEQIGPTLCLNAGQNQKQLRYLVLDLGFPAATPCLVREIKVKLGH